MVMGAAVAELLSRLTDADLEREAMPWMSAAMITLAGVNMLAMRVSYVGELGWGCILRRMICRVYAEIEKAGADLGLIDFGSHALNAMRIEKGYHGWGADFGTEYTMHDAGLAGFANLGKGAFIGRDTVAAGTEKPAAWQFAGFVVDSPDVIRCRVTLSCWMAGLSAMLRLAVRISYRQAACAWLCGRRSG